MLVNRKIESSKLLLVEGIEDLHLFTALIDYMIENEDGCEKLTDIQLWKYDGGGNLKKDLKVIRLSREYKTILKKIAITSDAEDNAESKFQSITHHLTNNGYPCPATQLTPTESNPSVVVLTIPCTGQGMIEDICLESVKNDPAMCCVDKYFDCLNAELTENGLDVPSNTSKAKLQAFLASRKKPNLRLGTAAKRKCYPFENAVFDEMKEILRLML